MPFRRTFVAAAIALALGGTMLPIGSTDAQIGEPAAVPQDTHKSPPDIGWIGLLGLVGLFGLFGSRRADRTMT
jgi:MYXO-CTERM domain-containing protein